MFNRVLLVDDSKSARFALRKLLEGKGLHVDTAETGEEALGYLNSHQPDLIFMDHLMPGMDGFEAVARIKQQPDKAGIPIVMCTSKDDADYIRLAKEQGASDILPKPATSHALNNLLSSLSKAIGNGHSAPNGSTSPVRPSGSSVASVPMLDDVVVPIETIERVATEAAEIVVNQLVAESVSKALEAKVPDLRDMVLEHFDVVAKSMLSGYLEKAMTKAKQEFTTIAEQESRKVAREVAAQAMDSDISAKLEVVREDVTRELNEQLSEIYSNIGDLKANQQLRKVAPELMSDILNQAREAASTEAESALMEAADIAKRHARENTEKAFAEAVKAFKVEAEQEMAASLQAGLESARQEAAEVAWEKINSFQNTNAVGSWGSKLISGLALTTSILALLGVAFLMF